MVERGEERFQTPTDSTGLAPSFLCFESATVLMASSAVVDPLQTLQAALTVQANSKEQADILDSLREYLEAQPALIPVLAGTLVGQVVNGGDSLLKSWVFNLLHFAICRSALSQDVRTTRESPSLLSRQFALMALRV